MRGAAGRAWSRGPTFWWPEVFWVHRGRARALRRGARRRRRSTPTGTSPTRSRASGTAASPNRELFVWDLQATNPIARAALWEFVFGVDLVVKIIGDEPPARRAAALPARRSAPAAHRLPTSTRCGCCRSTSAALLGGAHVRDAGQLDDRGRRSRRIARRGSRSTVAPTARAAGEAVERVARPLAARARRSARCSLGGNSWATLAEAGEVDEHARGRDRASRRDVRHRARARDAHLVLARRRSASEVDAGEPEAGGLELGAGRHHLRARPQAVELFDPAPLDDAAAERDAGVVVAAVELEAEQPVDERGRLAAVEAMALAALRRCARARSSSARRASRRRCRCSPRAPTRIVAATRAAGAWRSDRIAPSSALGSPSWVSDAIDDGSVRLRSPSCSWSASGCTSYAPTYSVASRSSSSRTHGTERCAPCTTSRSASA